MRWIEVKTTDVLNGIKTGKKDVNQALTSGFHPFFSCARETTLFSNDAFLNKDAIIIAGNGSYTGHVKKHSGPFDLYQRTYALYDFNENVDWRFIYFIFKNQFEKRYMGGTSGSAVPYITMPIITNFKFNIPLEKEIQTRIADQLWILDDKIENNLRMNETLEEMARAVFKSWFVDFDPVHAKATDNPPAHMNTATAALFPNSFGNDDLPMGWTWRKLGDCVSLTKGRSYKSAELQDSDTALVSLKSFQRGGGYRPDGLKAYTGTYKDEQTLVSGDLIVALTDVTQAADVIGKPAIVRSNNEFKTLVASLDVGVIRPIVPSVSIPFLYCMMMMHNFQAHIYGHTSGTTVLHLGKEGVPKYEFGVPSCEILDKFTDLAQPIFSKIELNENNSNTLAELRDTLLPKLISGEIRVKDAERKMEAAI